METKHFKIPIQSRIAFFQISEKKWVSIYNFMCIDSRQRLKMRHFQKME